MLVVLVFSLVSSTRQLPVPVRALEYGQSTFFMSVDGQAEFDFQWLNGWSSLYGNTGNGYILSAMQTTPRMLYVQMFRGSLDEAYGIMPEDGYCFVKVDENTYFTFISVNNRGLIYEGRLSQTECIRGKG